jgi:hypothetical protein
MLRFFLLVLILFPAFLYSQTLTPQTVKTNIEQYGAGFPQEKMYLQFDKPVYAPGETIWFKAYLMQGIDPSTISANLYIVFADDNGNVLLPVVAPVVQASAKGNFDIPLSFTGKRIHIRAYTKWMLNFDSSFLYNKDIPVIQTKVVATKNTPSQTKSSVQFFPEGGDCIAGINNKIAFKAVAYNGRPVNIKGTIVNSKGQNVGDIKCIHDGMGFFYLEATVGETYTAKWKDEQETSYQTPLPAVKNNGVSLEVKVANGARGFLIKRPENASDNFKQLHVVGTMQQQLVYMAGVNLSASNMTGGSIPTLQLPSGILQITLFDSNWNAVAERITFINNDDYHFDPEVGFAALGTSKHGKNTLVIDLPDTVESNLSVAVTDAGVGIDSSDDIISHLLLTSDLKGNVYKPFYYFQNNSDSLQQQLDLVMLTNGWRKIKWEDVVFGKMPKIKYTNDTSYLSLSGKVYGTASDIRSTGLLFMVLENPKDTSRQMVQSFLDKDGSFSNPNIILFDTTKVYYKLAGAGNSGSGAAVSFNPGLIQSPAHITFDKNNPLFYVDTAEESRIRFFAEQEAQLAKFAQGTTLAAVTVKAKTKSPQQVLDEKYSSGLFSGGQAKAFDITNDPNARAAQSVFTYLQGRVAGLMISVSGAPGGQPSVTYRGGAPSFYLDEMPVDVSQLENMPMTDVAYVKVFEPPFFGAFGGGSNGAIAVYTQKGGSQPAAKGKGLPFKIVTGYTAQKEFYSPNYGTFDKRNEEADMRSTLYWNPMIITTRENHIIRLIFYNNDISNSFHVVVEGVSKDGRLTHVEKTIE